MRCWFWGKIANNKEKDDWQRLRDHPHMAHDCRVSTDGHTLPSLLYPCFIMLYDRWTHRWTHRLTSVYGSFYSWGKELFCLMVLEGTMTSHQSIIFDCNVLILVWVQVSISYTFCGSLGSPGPGWDLFSLIKSDTHFHDITHSLTHSSRLILAIFSCVLACSGAFVLSDDNCHLPFLLKQQSLWESCETEAVLICAYSLFWLHISEAGVSVVFKVTTGVQWAQHYLAGFLVLNW